MRTAAQCPRCSKRLPAGAAFCNRCGFNIESAGRRMAEFTGQGARVLRYGVIALVLMIVVLPLVTSAAGDGGGCSGARSTSRVEQTPDGRTNVDVRSVGGCSASNTVRVNDAPPPRSAVTAPPPTTGPAGQAPAD